MSLADHSLQFFPVSARVSVLQARGLRIKGKDGTNDAYTALQAGRETFRTPVSEKRAEPVWGGNDSAFIFTLPAESARSEQDGGALQVRVMHRVPLGVDKLLGLAIINVHELRHNGARENPQWFKLLNKTGKADKERGEILLDIQFLKSSMSVSMIDLSDKSHSRIGKFKDKLRGKKKDGMSDSVSAIVPSVTQVLTDSEGEMDGEMEGEPTKKKKNKLKSLFVPKSNMKRNSMSQSMSSLGTLPDKNSSISSSTSSGLNVESSEGKKKKKFTFLTHKRNSSTDSKTSNHSDFTLGSANQNPPSQVDISINGSRVYREATQSEEVQEMDEEEDEEEEGEKENEEERWRRDKEEQEHLVELRRREAERERMRKEKEEEEEKERIRREREKEEHRRRMEEEEKERMRLEREKEVQRRRMEEEEKERIRMEREKEEQRRRMEEEEKERKRMEREKEEQKRRMEEEEKERIRKEREKEEQRRRMEEEEKERIRMEREKEEQRRRIEEEKEKERIRMEREKEEQRRSLEEKEKERIRMEREKEEQRRRMEEEEQERQRIEKDVLKRKLEEEERMRIKREQEEQLRKLEEESKRKEEREAEELRRKMKKEYDRRKAEEEEKLRITEEERMKEEKRRVETKRMEEEVKQKEERRIEMERKLADEKKAREEEERRVAEEKQRKEEEKERKRAEMEIKRKEEERRNMEMEEKKKKERQMREEQEKPKMEENLFAESVIPQSTDFTRSARISNVKPSVSISATVSQPCLENTNPFLDDLDVSISETVIDPEETAAKKGRAPLPPQLTGQDVFSRGVPKQHSNLKEVSKRPAPQPPGILKMEKEVTNMDQAGFGQEAKKDSNETIMSQDDRQVDTYPFTCDEPVTVKHTKRPAPKPRSLMSVSGGKNLTEGIEEKTSASNSKDSKVSKDITVKDVKSDLSEDLLQTEEPLENIVELNSSKPNTPSRVHQDLGTEPLICDTDELPGMDRSQKKSQAPLPPAKPKRTGDPRTPHQQPSRTNKTNGQVPSVETPATSTPSSTVSSSIFTPLAKTSQVMKPCVTESVEAVSGSGVTTLPWANLVPNDAGEVREQISSSSVIRQQAVKPLSAAEDQSEAYESRGADNTQPKTKAAEAIAKGPYSQLTRSELISLALRQQEQISQRDARIQELEGYIDNLLVRVMEEKPSILMTLNAKNKST